MTGTIAYLPWRAAHARSAWLRSSTRMTFTCLLARTTRSTRLATVAPLPDHSVSPTPPSSGWTTHTDSPAAHTSGAAWGPGPEVTRWVLQAMVAGRTALSTTASSLDLARPAAPSATPVLTYLRARPLTPGHPHRPTPARRPVDRVDDAHVLHRVGRAGRDRGALAHRRHEGA